MNMVVQAEAQSQSSMPLSSPREQWERIKACLRAQLGEDVFTSWFGRLEFVEISGRVVHLSVPTRFLQSWLKNHYADNLEKLWTAEVGEEVAIEISVRDFIKPLLHHAPQPEENVPRHIVAPFSPPTDKPMASILREPKSIASPVDHRFDFDNFCEGAGNRVAFAALRMITERATSHAFNPLFIHAGVGRGKTHLLHATARAAQRIWPDRKVVYLTAEYLMYQYVAAFRTQGLTTFTQALRGIDLLLIDDMQFLRGRSVQQEFCHVLNTLIDSAHQVVVASDRPPVELEGLDERVRSRLQGGLVLEIEAPDIETRRSIISRRLTIARENNPGFEISNEVREYIAHHIISNGRDLEGALNRLIAYQDYTHQTVTLAGAEATLRDLVGAREPPRIRIEDIQRAVAKHYQVSKADMLSARRTRTIVRPRQIGMYLAKVLTPRSLPEIGRRFGGRDHTTVLHAVRKIEELIAQDPTLKDEIEMLKHMLGE